jgi:hypothetical protein
MSDPISISGTAVGIVSLGLAVAQGLYLIADSIGSAGREVRMYGDEIDSFSKLLNRVRIELENSPAHRLFSSKNLLILAEAKISKANFEGTDCGPRGLFHLQCLISRLLMR